MAEVRESCSGTAQILLLFSDENGSFTVYWD